MTLGELLGLTRDRLGDLAAAIWTDDELIVALQNGLQQIATASRVFYDWAFLENLPRVFSYTEAWEAAYLARAPLTLVTSTVSTLFTYSQPWEQAFVTHLATGIDSGWANLTSAFERTAGAGLVGFLYGPGNHTNVFEETNGHLATAGLLATRSRITDTIGGIDLGWANFTYADERQLLGDTRLRSGPANSTTNFEATDGFLGRAGASTAIPATAEMPASVIALTRVTWDQRGIDGMEPRRLQRVDSRYEITVGEVYGFLWQKDGVRTLRKVRVPGAQADTVVVDGAWGILRDPADLTGATVTGTWGVPRRLPGHHPIGPGLFGLPRRPFLEGKNVRVEHSRQAQAFAARTDVCELPDRQALYLRDYALAQALQRSGPGQDVALAAHFAQRWQRDLARVQRRLDRLDREHVTVLGGDGQSLTSRPPRPKLPWQYGSRVR